MMGTIYLIHFSQPIGDLSNRRGQAQHYLGYADDLEARLERHRRGNGARIMQVIVERGIEWEVVRTWEGDRKIERRLKNLHNSPLLCPKCRKLRSIT